MTAESRSASICILPHLQGLGGPASFRARLVQGLESRGVRVVDTPNDPNCACILVIGGLSRMQVLWQARRRGIRIVQRLNGMNWIHRRRFTNLRHFLRSEWNNFVLSTIRRFLADRIVYQSQFSRTWWHTVYHSVKASSSVIYNGVNLAEFSPGDPSQIPTNRYRILLVEGRLGNGYEMGLENAVRLAQQLNGTLDRAIELKVVGEVPPDLRAFYEPVNQFGLINWHGVIRREEVAAVDRTAHVLFSADLNAACPNAVVEALACGLPVVSYATGALPEMVQCDAGLVVPWGSNFWKLEPPQLPLLVDATRRILFNQPQYRLGARKQAEATFSLENMVDQYLNVLFG